MCTFPLQIVEKNDKEAIAELLSQVEGMTLAKSDVTMYLVDKSWMWGQKR